MDESLPMTISIIAALSPNHAIGYKGQLPWHIPEDLHRFKRLTTGHTIIMGRKTFESLPHGALPHRRNIVVSHQTQQLEGCEVSHSLEEALVRCKDEEEVFIIGGASLYQQALPLTRRLYLTLVDSNPQQADTFFPFLNVGEWKETKKEKRVGFSFVVWDRKAV